MMALIYEGKCVLYASIHLKEIYYDYDHCDSNSLLSVLSHMMIDKQMYIHSSAFMGTLTDSSGNIYVSNTNAASVDFVNYGYGMSIIKTGNNHSAILLKYFAE